MARKRKPKCGICQGDGTQLTYRGCDEEGATGAVLCSCIEARISELERALQAADRVAELLRLGISEDTGDGFDWLAQEALAAYRKARGPV